MERLTKSINGMVWFASQDADLWLEPYEMSTHDIRTAIKKLADYEDTGMSPDELNDLRRDLRVCSNELCLKCGDYKMAHKGACDGCRWKDMGD